MHIQSKALALSAALLGGVALSAGGAFAQDEEIQSAEDQIVNILQEPRHRIVHNDGDIWVLDIQINPGDATKRHTHDSAILYTFISSGTGPSGGRLNSNTDYVEENYTHRARNEGPGLFRIIAVANYGEPQEELTAGRPTGLEGEPALENPWFRSYRMTLKPDEMTPPQNHENPTVVVQVTEGISHVTREDGITAEFTGMGSWTWRDANSPFQIHNASSHDIEVVINEARR
ncbi:MAG: hypothetical protein R3332_03420 [Pseudohongiellaceae bacterium]|nr:hypothetical protein [Pseudohongiellaceae bacterium]